MRNLKWLSVGAALVLAAACSSESDLGSNDGADGTTATTATVGTDGTTGTTGAEGTDGTTGTEGTTSADGSDGTTTCEPFCAPDWECGPDGCGGQCGAGCADGKVCNAAQHACEDPPAPPVPLAKFGEYCGIADSCVPTLNDGTDNPAWPACANAQCETNTCLISFGDAGVCSKNCTVSQDQTDAQGNPGPDGIDDPNAGFNDCAGAAAGPYGTSFTCVQWVDPTQGQGLNLCMPGTTFADCKADSDCPTGEVCGFKYVQSQYVTKCQTAREGGVASGSFCNSDPYYGEVIYCANDFCRGGSCLTFCKETTDCASHQECEVGQQIYTNVEVLFDFCNGSSCFSNNDCPEGTGCRLYWNGESGEAAGWDPVCSTAKDGAVQTGEACDADPNDGVEGPACVGPCLNSGTCSSYCLEDGDCTNGNVNMLCSINEYDFDLLPEGAPDDVPEFYLAAGLCIPADGSNTDCFTNADCSATPGEVCQFFEVINDATGKPDAKGVCVTVDDPSDGDVGDLCGGDTGLGCKDGFCLPTFNDGSGVCASLCSSSDDCPKNISVNGITLDMGCTTLLYGVALTIDDITDNVWAPLCRAYNDDPNDFPPCNADYSCDGADSACIGTAIAFGATGPGSVDYRCYDMTDADGVAPTGELGAACDVDTSDESTVGNGVSCKNAYCMDEATGADAGYCSKICDVDADCAGVPGTICDDLVTLPRAVGNLGPKVCQKAESCIPCFTSSGCAGNYECANVGGAGAQANMRCVPSCSVDADCAGTDGGSSCVDLTDEDGTSTGITGCKVDACN